MKLLRQGPQGTSRRRADPPAIGAITWHSRSDALINGIAVIQLPDYHGFIFCRVIRHASSPSCPSGVAWHQDAIGAFVMPLASIIPGA